jgi:hypothetical protein
METATAPSVPARPATESFGTKRVLLIVFGSIALLLAVALLAVGGGAVWALGERDDSDYLTTEAHGFATNGHALASENLEVSDVPRWFTDRATLRIEATSTEPVFVGIGPTSEVERYLAGVPHSEITDVEADPFSAEYRHVGGGREPGVPASQDFWRVQASGAGTQTITWPLEEGDWSAVAMNADGSRNVILDASFGAKVSALGWVAFGFLAAGGLVLLTGGILVYLGVRRPRHV